MANSSKLSCHRTTERFVSWIDGVGRQFASADYGTNGGTAFTRPATVPTRSDTILVSTTSYNDDGEVFSTLDPQNTETRFEYDAAGRQVTQIENYVSSGTAADQNRTTWTTHTADGQLKALTASNADTGNQQTKYDYGTTLSNSNIASSQLLRFVTYPDALGTGTDFVTYSYNRQGQQRLVVDQRGCQHGYDYDGLGRQIHDRVLSLGTSAVGTARRLSTIYNTRGMVDRVTTWDDPRVGFGTVLNQVQSLYNDFGQQTHSYQEHGGGVNTSTTPKVQYGYTNGTGNTIRMAGMTYPSGRGLTYGYGTANAINDACSRIESVINTSDSVNLATYQYLGASGFVNAASAQPGINWTLIGTGNDPATGDIYWGLDLFGRVDNCLWQKGTTTLGQIQYGYDRASNRTWRKDGVLTGYDELYSYDGLYRLTDQKRGTLNGTQTAITSGTFEQQWGLDPTGNWKTFKQDNDGNGTWELNQTRVANKVNEITGITNSVGTAWVTPTYDGAGNMIGIPNPPATTTGATPAWVPMSEAQWNTLTEAQWNTFTENTGTTPQALSARYDAWNRLVLITNGTQKVSENVYDARGYRIRKDTYTSGTLTEARHYYYTPGWQCVEERVGTTTTAERQFVWGQRYIDDLILRDRSTANNGTMNERRYAMQDGNWNTIAICDITGSVTERYAYSAYGTPVFMNGSGTVQSASAIGFEILYAGYRFDGTTPQMYYVRNRFLLPMIGTWNRRDPLGYVDGMSLVVYAKNLPLNRIDRLGLSASPPLTNSATARPKPTCVLVLAIQGTSGDPDKPNDYERWYPDALRYKREVDPTAKIFVGVNSSNIARFIRQGKCCSVITLGHKGGLANPGQIGPDDDPIFPNEAVEKEIGIAFGKNGCNGNCEIDVFGCQYRGVASLPSEQPNFCFFRPEARDPDVLKAIIEEQRPLEEKTWEEASIRMNCRIKTSVHTLRIGTSHTCVPSGSRKGYLCYPRREVFIGGRCVYGTEEVWP